MAEQEDPINSLATALKDGACLVNSSSENGPLSNLKDILDSRLARYFTQREKGFTPSRSLDEAQITTASEALNVVERVQTILGKTGMDAGPAIGTRDLGQLRTLISLVFKWGTVILLEKVVVAWFSAPQQSIMVDLTSLAEAYRLLAAFVARLFSLLYPDGAQRPILQTPITATILSRHVGDMVYPAIALGWLPKPMSSELMPVRDEFRPLTLRLLSILQPSHTISSVGHLLASKPPPHVQKTCSFLLGRQLLRREGVQGLCEAMFSQEESISDAAPIEKMEHFAYVLMTVPANVEPKNYVEHIVSRLLALLSVHAPQNYRRATAFTLSRMLTGLEHKQHHNLFSSKILSLLHGPFQQVSGDRSPLQSSLIATPGCKPTIALSHISTLILNTDPSPSFISNLLSPILPTLYSLLFHIDSTKTSNVSLRESLRGILITWGKIVSTIEGVQIIWSIIDQEFPFHWQVDCDDQISVLQSPSETQSLLSMLISKDKLESFVDDADTNLFKQYPDPIHLVKFLKDIDRSDVSSELFVRLLEIYNAQRGQDGNSMRILLHLQIIMRLQRQLSGSTSSSLLQKSAQLLRFVKHSLETSIQSTSEQRRTKFGLVLGQLQLNSQSTDDVEGDSDDDMPDSEIAEPDDEMIDVSISLLLSVLEAHDAQPTEALTVLNDIFTLLTSISRNASMPVRKLAREARMVITARLASSSREVKCKSQTDTTAQQTYQEALQLLQDPILPVRAHGLLLLRSLFTQPDRGDPSDAKLTDPALIPAILSIFLQSIQDEDSYIYLNAVQGLAAMVDRFGKDVLKGLIQEYSNDLHGLSSITPTQQDIDAKLRIGEALNLVIKRCGDALGVYADLIVPPLFRIVRSRKAPMSLRTSSLSLLAHCAHTYALGILPYLHDLSCAMLDLLQTETVTTEMERGSESATPMMDSHPMSTNSKLPPLRRAAIHFIQTMIRDVMTRITPPPFQTGLVRRMKVALGYTAATDVDKVVRLMAREALESLHEMRDRL